MLHPPDSIDEPSRIAALDRYQVMDSEFEMEFDEITRLASEICKTPISLISLIDDSRQWFKSRVGLDVSQTPRNISFCGHAIGQDNLFEVRDAKKDERFSDNPLTEGSSPVRFYAGAPLVTADGFRLGTLCVIDHVPRELDRVQRNAMSMLSRQVMRLMEARLLARQHRHSMEFLQTLIDNVPVGITVKKLDADYPRGNGVMTHWNPAAEQMTGVAASAVLGRDMHEVLDADRAAASLANEDEVIDCKVSVVTPVYPITRADGTKRLLRVTSVPLFDRDGNVEYILRLTEDNTELLNQEKSLRQSHAELEAINHSLPMGLFHTNAAGICTYINPGFETITGLYDGRALGLGWRDAIHPDDVERVTTDWFYCAQRHLPYNSTFRFVHASGREVLVRSRAASVNVDGVYSGYVGTLDDITERHALNKSLAESERRLRLITDNMPALVTQVDLDRRLHFINRMSQRIFAMKPEEMIGKSMRDVYPAGLLKIIEPQMARALAGETVTFNGSIDRPEGELYFQTTYVPDTDENGRVQGLFGMGFDVTARKQAELLLEANERRLRMITDNLPVAITYIDRERRFQFANTTMQQWIGKPRTPLEGRRLDEVLGRHDYLERIEYLERALAGHRVDFEKAPNEDQPRYLQTTYLPDIDDNGEVRGIYTIGNDISAHKRNEEALKRMARFDSLTGLPNRVHLYETLDAALARCKRSGTALAVLFLDIDHFKSINDTLGHAKGDLVLKEFATRLVGCVRGTDTVARLAGDEFVIVLESLRGAEDAEFVAGKVLQQVGKPWILNGDRLKVTTSIGLAFDESHSHNGDELIALADEMLYAAKDGGRNGFKAKCV
jgi:diguanylate cyclase (GGDEF)-like protein/PAS domain S-box-containing protein